MLPKLGSVDRCRACGQQRFADVNGRTHPVQYGFGLEAMTIAKADGETSPGSLVVRCKSCGFWWQESPFAGQADPDEVSEPESLISCDAICVIEWGSPREQNSRPMSTSASCWQSASHRGPHRFVAVRP
jgi:hypothetical protein